MRLLILSAMVFFGTLLAAGLLALAEPQATTGAGLADHAAALPTLLARAATAPPRR